MQRFIHWIGYRFSSSVVLSKELTLVVKVSPDGKSLNLASTCGGFNANYHSIWLRHNCHCNTCLSSSGQKMMSGKLINKDTVISKALIKDTQLQVEWREKNSSLNHFGNFGLSWLQENCYDQEKLEAKRREKTPKKTMTLPFIDYQDIITSDEGLWKWLYHLNNDGVCIINDVPTTEDHVAEQISNVQNTVYGEMFDVKTEKKLTNIAYSEVGLELHMDLMYYQSPPGLQLLHCLKNDPCVEGGESTLLDGFGVVEELRKEYPKYFEVLAKVHVPFEKFHYERDNPVEMIYHKPHIELDRNKQVVGINWAPAHQGTLSVSEELVEDFYEAYIHLFEMINESSSIMRHRLIPGQLLSFNNRRMLHGRTPYKSNGGERHLKGLYVNIDEFASKFHVLSKLLNKHNPVKHVFNTSYYI